MTRILMIDDDPDIILSTRMVLEAHGYEVAELNHVRHLSDDVRRIAPDLIILDVMFPEDPQAGFKAARELSKNPELKDIPVLLLSAVNQRNQLGFAFSSADISADFMPVSAFVDKPIEPKTLLALIRDHLAP